MFEQFTKCSDFLRQTPIQAKSRKHLTNLLNDHQANGIFFTTMQKFEESSDVLTDRSDVIVISDEAHRSQYGLEEKVNPETGKIEKTPVNVEFKVKRLTEAENTHILNHKLIGKEIADMTDEEYVQSSQFRSKVLEKAVVEPQLSAKEWQNNCSNADISAIYDEVNKILTEADDVSLFQ